MIAACSIHSGGEIVSYYINDTEIVTAKMSLYHDSQDEEGVNNLSPLTPFEQNFLSEDELKINNTVVRKRRGIVMRRTGKRRRNGRSGRSQMHFRTDKGLRSKRPKHEMEFEDYQSDYDDVIGLYFEYFEDEARYEEMTYNQYLAELKKAS